MCGRAGGVADGVRSSQESRVRRRDQGKRRLRVELFGVPQRRQRREENGAGIEGCVQEGKAEKRKKAHRSQHPRADQRRRERDAVLRRYADARRKERRRRIFEDVIVYRCKYASPSSSPA